MFLFEISARRALSSFVSVEVGRALRRLGTEREREKQKIKERTTKRIFIHMFGGLYNREVMRVLMNFQCVRVIILFRSDIFFALISPFSLREKALDFAFSILPWPLSSPS